MTVRNLAFFLTAFTLTACGQAQSVSSDLSKADGADCTSAAIEKQFIVKGHDGSVKVIQAESEDAFIHGYLAQHKAEIQIAEHDYKVKAAMVKVTSADNTTTQADNWGPIKIEADKLWAQNVRGSQIVVAVIDTGMDINHPQLAGQVFFNPGEAGTDAHGNPKPSNSIDDDGNGYVDDYAGYDFYDKKGLTGDNQYHGTHVSGIIAAAHNDTVAKPETYVQGVAPGVKLLPLAFLGGPDGEGNMSDAVLAIQYAVARGARVINASWGGTQCSATLRDAIAGLQAKNVIFVAAAGNDAVNTDRSPEYPASLNLFSQFTVGAVGVHDYMSIYSDYGATTVHIFAPGDNIVSTLPGGQMGFLSGTSMATPFVTGAVALLLSAIPDYINASQGRLDLAQALVQLHAITGH
jgi:subtilisin family serine protease